DGIVDAIDGLVQGGARVVAAGLAQDFRGLPFGAMPTLLCIAEFVDKLEAVCHRCGGPATMTQRLVDGEPAPFGGETIQVGALDGGGGLRAFINVCRHRGAVLMDGCGTRRTLQCHYHAWTYGLDGSLRSAPRSDRELSFDGGEWSLLPAAVGMWGPFLFVNP